MALPAGRISPQMAARMVGTSAARPTMQSLRAPAPSLAQYQQQQAQALFRSLPQPQRIPTQAAPQAQRLVNGLPAAAPQVRLAPTAQQLQTAQINAAAERARIAAGQRTPAQSVQSIANYLAPGQQGYVNPPRATAAQMAPPDPRSQVALAQQQRINDKLRQQQLAQAQQILGPVAPPQSAPMTMGQNLMPAPRAQMLDPRLAASYGGSTLTTQPMPQQIPLSYYGSGLMPGSAPMNQQPIARYGSNLTMPMPDPVTGLMPRF